LASELYESAPYWNVSSPVVDRDAARRRLVGFAQAVREACAGQDRLIFTKYWLSLMERSPSSGRGSTLPDMKKSDVTCPQCHAGYRRVELVSKKGIKGEFRCLICNHLLEVFDGATEVGLRVTIQPEKLFG
jgi:hypothetical protein